MATEIKPEMIKEIAEMLDAGMICFYHKTTGEMEYYPDEMRDFGFDEGPWEDVINKIDENPEDYLRFKGMESYESFKIMEHFIADIDDIPTHNRFIAAISRKKPFRNFSDLLLDYPFLRQRWFNFKEEKYIEFVKGQLDDHNREPIS